MVIATDAEKFHMVNPINNESTVPVGRTRALPYTLFTFSCRLLRLDLFTLYRQMAAMSPPEVTWVGY